MIEQALKYIADIGSKSMLPQKLPTTNPEVERFLINGDVVEFPVPNPDRQHTVGDVDGLISVVDDFFGREVCKIRIWVDREAVVCIIHDDERRTDRVTLPLVYSGVFAALLAHKSPVNQDDFVKLLRIPFRKALAPGELLNQVQTIKFDSGVMTTGTAARGAQSVTQEARQRVAVEEKTPIPETVVLKVPVYRNPGETETFPVECYVEIDPQTRTFQLIPLPDAIPQAVDLALASIRRRLAAGLPEGVEQRLGKP